MLNGNSASATDFSWQFFWKFLKNLRFLIENSKFWLRMSSPSSTIDSIVYDVYANITCLQISGTTYLVMKRPSSAVSEVDAWGGRIYWTEFFTVQLWVLLTWFDLKFSEHNLCYFTLRLINVHFIPSPPLKFMMVGNSHQRWSSWIFSASVPFI